MRVRRTFLPVERRDFTRNHVDEHGVHNAGVLDGQRGGEGGKTFPGLLCAAIQYATMALPEAARKP